MCLMNNADVTASAAGSAPNSNFHRAVAVARQWYSDSPPDSLKVVALSALIRLALAEAQHEEREACAKLADDEELRCLGATAISIRERPPVQP